MTMPSSQAGGESSKEARAAGARPSLQQVIRGLDPASDPSARAIASAVRQFNHKNTTLHDHEISLGSASALCELLHRALLGVDTSIVAESEDNGEQLHRWRSARVAMTCSALEMTLRCSSAVLQSTFRRLGSRTLMSAIVDALEEFATSGDRRSNAARLVLRSCAKILRRLSDAAVALAVGEREVRTLVSLLIRILQGGECLETDVDTFATIASLSCAVANRPLMTNFPGLLDMLLTSSREEGPRRRCATEATRALRNLSRCDRSRRVIRGRGDVVKALATWINDSRPTVRRLAVSAAKNISAKSREESDLAIDCKRRLIEALSVSLQNGGGESATRTSCKRALKNLFNGEAPSALVVSTADFLVTLSRANDKEVSEDAWNEVMATLLEPISLSSLSQLPRESRDAVLTALTRLCARSDCDSTACLVAGTLEFMSLTPRNQSIMARHGRLLGALARLVQSGNEGVSLKATTVVRNLFLKPENGDVLWHGRGRDLLTTVMDTISGALEVSGDTMELCVQTIACLASCKENRRRLAGFSFLVPSLIECVAEISFADENVKTAALKSIVQLSQVSLEAREHKGSASDAEETSLSSSNDCSDNDSDWMDFVPDMFTEVEI